LQRAPFRLDLSNLPAIRKLTDDKSENLTMETSANQNASVQAELLRRHKATSTTVIALLVGVMLLCILAFVTKKFLPLQNNPSLDIAVRITILIFGLGSVALRRTKFAAMRLQDIAALKGPTGLLITLQRTTLQVAILGAIVSVMGFAATLLTGNDFYTYGAGLVALAVLLYCYPVRTSWQQAIKRFSPAQNGD
jgi:tetrahydromethanopterin S-methyltransferase subunit D